MPQPSSNCLPSKIITFAFFEGKKEIILKKTKQQTNSRNCADVFALTITVHLQQFISMGK